MGNILVADDDKTCRVSIQKVLEREGHMVETAEDVEGALEASIPDGATVLECVDELLVHPPC